MELLKDRLDRARHDSFVGRSVELAQFRDALDVPGVLFVHGPGGIGKSSLLEAFSRAARGAGRPVVDFDARHLPSSPGTLPAASGHERAVILIDTYELLEGMDDWVREEYLPSLPGDVLVVIAGRRPPGPRWRADPAWRPLMRTAALGTLTAHEARTYLAGQGVPADLHPDLLAAGHGHPLTLSLLVDAVRRGVVPRSLADVPDVLGQLLAQMTEEVPTPAHRTALEICAHTPVTTEALLREVLGDGAHELFAWLRTLSFVHEGPYGLYPHDVVRDALDSDLRWRDPQRYLDLDRRLTGARLARLRATPDEQERMQLVIDSIRLGAARSRDETCTASPPTMQAYVDDLSTGDHEPILAMTEAWQGPEQAALVAYWLGRSPGAFRVFRTRSGEPRGYAACLDLTGADAGSEAGVDSGLAGDLAVDPGAAAMWRHAREQAPPRPGERVRAWRFFLDRDHGQGASPSVTLFMACQVLDALTRPDNAWTLVGAYADARQWAPTMAGLEFVQVGGYQVADRHFPVFAHDWRQSGAVAWVRHLGARHVEGRSADRGPARVVLSRNDFTEAVRAGLRDLHRAERLATNPLMRSRVVEDGRDGDSPAVTAEALAGLLGTAAGALEPGLRELVDRTFLRPTTTQERVAQDLHLSFNTFRRHRDRAVATITQWLWERETGGPRPGES